MHDPIPEPQRDKDVLMWALPVTRALNALADKTGADTRNERNRHGLFRHPFEVFWAADENNSSGAWDIYLPDIAKCLLVGDSYVTPTGVTASAVHPVGWYVTDIPASGGDLWLNYYTVTNPITHSVIRTYAEFDDSQGSSSTGTTVVSIKIASTSTSSSGGVVTHTIKQLVDSALTISSGAGEGCTGYTGYKTVWAGEDYNSDDNHKLVVHRERWRFENGLLKEIQAETDLEVFTSVAHGCLPSADEEGSN